MSGVSARWVGGLVGDFLKVLIKNICVSPAPSDDAFKGISKDLVTVLQPEPWLLPGWFESRRVCESKSPTTPAGPSAQHSPPQLRRGAQFQARSPTSLFNPSVLDDRCVRILDNLSCRLAREGRVLVVDNVVTPGNDPHRGKQLDS